MPEKFMIDTAIWIDALEDRKGFNNEPLGNYAEKLFAKILASGDFIVISDILMAELERYYSLDVINGVFSQFKFKEKVLSTKAEIDEARTIAKERGIPNGDALQAVLSRNHSFVMITRDRHFMKVRDICESFYPEDFI